MGDGKYVLIYELGVFLERGLISEHNVPQLFLLSTN